MDGVEGRIRRYTEHNPDVGVIDVLGALTLSPEHSEVVEDVLNGEDIQDTTEGDDWIDDPDFDGSVKAVRDHYRRVRPVYKAFSVLDGAPPTIIMGNAGWYRYRYEHELAFDDLEAGYRVWRRAHTFERDYDRIVSSLQPVEDDSSWRSAYNIASWKDRDAVYAGAFARDSDGYGRGDGLAGYGDMRGFSLWVDLDLEDNDHGADGPNLKKQRGDLDDDQRSTVELALAAYAEEFAALLGVNTEDIPVFDSGGGAYLYAPAGVTIAIAEHLEDEDGPFGDARSLLFRELRARMFAYATGTPVNANASDYGFEGIETRVNKRVPGARELLNPDWMQNQNRQSKAPMSIHGDHDVVVTPVRDDTGTFCYEPTLVSDVDDDLLERTADEAAKIVSTHEIETTEAFISTLFPEMYDREGVDEWREAIEAWLDDERGRQRDQAHQEAIDRRRQHERLDANREELAAALDKEPADVTLTDSLANVDVTPVQQDVYDALSNRDIVDIRDVIRDHASDDFDTSNRGHEITANPNWRGSSSGKSIAIPNGENRFIDNGCDGGGGPAKAFALGTGILSQTDNAAAMPLTGQAFRDALNGLRTAGAPIPVHVPEAGSTDSDGETYEKTPYWGIVKAAVALGVCESDDLVKREGEDGGTYQALPDTETYNETLEALEDAGIEHGRGSTPDHVAILPNTPVERARTGAVTTWDWRGEANDTLTTEDVRGRTLDAIASAYEQAKGRVLIDAIMSSGKSYGAVKAAADTDEPITFLTGRGREEQYEQIQEWCDEHGLTSIILPTISDCDTYSGRYEDEHDHAEAQKKAVRRWYDAGATGKDIHIHAEEELGQPLVCDGPAGARCTYKVKWEAFNPDEYDVLIGHYNHAHVGNVVQGRTLVFDEFPEDTYLTEYGPSVASAVTAFLRRHEHVEELPDDYADVMEARTDDGRRADALTWLLDHGVERDGTLAFEQGGQANAPLATFTLLAAAENDLGNGFERAKLPGQYGDRDGDGVGVYDREGGQVQLLTPPDIRYASGIVALDGTPVPELWEIVLGAELNHRPVLTDGERAEYVRESQNIDIVRTTEYVKPYSGSPDNVYLEEDRALLNEIAGRHGQKPDLITTQTAETVYENDGDILESVNKRAHHGNVKGSNKFADSRLGAVIGSRHFGDRYVQLWGAFAGDRVERGDGRGIDLEYSGIGGEIHKHMTHHETMQAVMRFGRDGKGATVYVHTNTLPDWTPIAGEGRVPKVWSDGMQQVLDAANDRGEWRTADLAAHPAVDIGERQIRDHLHTLADRGMLTVTVDGRGFVWQDDGLHRVNDHGDVELPPVDIDDLADEEVAELARCVLYTWEFRKTMPERGETVAPGDSSTPKWSDRGDDPPPDTSYAD